MTTKITVKSKNKTKLTGVLLAGMMLGACSTMGFENSEPAAVPDTYATALIQQADWREAEQILRSGDLQDPLLQLNLAYVLRKMDRMEEAAGLYETIISGEQNPYATMVGGHPRRVKSVAKDAMIALNNTTEK